MSETTAGGLDHIAQITRALSRLSFEQLRVLADLCLRLPDIGHFTAERLQRELHIATAHAIGMTRMICGEPGKGSLRDVAVAAIACATREAALHQSSEKVDIVCTGPIQFAVPVRATFPTMIEMVEDARSEIVIVGYVFTAGAGEFVRKVEHARSRGVSVTIVGNRMRQNIVGLRRLWQNVQPPEVYSWESDGTDELASLHAKLLICDRSTALVTSANYSLHGLHENIEIGLKVRSASVERLNDFVKQLTTSGEVVPVPWT